MPLAIHEFSKEEIMAYLDGELSGESALAVAQHLESCEECREHASDFRTLAGQLADWAVKKSTAEAPNVALERFAPNRWFLRWPALSAGSLAILLALALLNQRQAERMMPQRESVRDRVLPISGVTGFAGNSERLPMALQRVNSNRSGGEVASGEATTTQTEQFERAPRIAADPLIVRTAQLRLTTGSFVQIRTDVERITKSHQGYIGQLQLETPSGGSRSLSASLHIPSPQLDAALLDLGKLGHVEGESQSGEDVTQRSVDLDARLKNLRTTEERLQKLLQDHTGKLSDVLEVEQAVDTTRGQIETAVAEQKNLASQISYASVQLNIAEQYRASLAVSDSTSATRLWNAAVDGCRSAYDNVISVASFLLSVGPTLLIIAVITFYPALLLWRKRDYLRRNA